jgi:pimeloyl-ACP methyl ester carboxylesterase
MPDVVCNGVRLNYERSGSGEPVVLISGTQMPPVLFDLALTPALVEAGYSAVTFSNRGVEPSESPPAPYSVAEMAADTAALIEVLGLGPSHLVGYSLGGFIAEELCYARPDLVRDVVLLASAGRGSSFLRAYLHAEVEMAEASDPPIASQVARDTMFFVHPVSTLQDDDATVEMFVEMFTSAPPWTNPGRLGQWSADLAWVCDDERTGRWKDQSKRCLAIAFEHDFAWSPSRVRAAADAMPDATFAMIEGAAHGGLITHGEQVCNAILGFLSKS